MNECSARKVLFNQKGPVGTFDQQAQHCFGFIVSPFEWCSYNRRSVATLQYLSFVVYSSKFDLIRQVVASEIASQNISRGK